MSINESSSAANPSTDEHTITPAPSASGSTVKPLITGKGVGDGANPASSGSSTMSDLETFQTALGIPVPRHDDRVSSSNKGIYVAVARFESRSKIAFHFCDYFISLCLLLQIIIAACLTAFGASKVNHSIIATFGGVNTALAGVIALMKGQGLPNRLRQDWNGWRNVRDYIEEREREIRAGKHGVDVWKEISTIEEMYDAARVTEENNRPDSYTVTGRQDKGVSNNV